MLVCSVLVQSALHSWHNNTDWMTEYCSGNWLRPGRARNHGSITCRVEKLYLFPNFLTRFVSHPVSPPVGTWGVLHGVKTARVFFFGGGDMISYIPIRIYDVHREIFTFTLIVVILGRVVDEKLSFSQGETCFVKVKMELKLFLCTPWICIGE